MKLAPIALFVYNRPLHTRQTIEALQKNILASESDLIIFSDGPKDSMESKEGFLAVREYLKTVRGFKNIKIIEREENYGLAKSIIAGVGEVVREYDRIIVLEDDMITSRYFLQYMNGALDLYENDDNVISVHGYTFPVKEDLPETYFLKGADCWGWATWKRGWDLFETDGQDLLEKLENNKLTEEFDFSGSYPYTQMLRDQISGKNNSWAIRWYASAFLKNKLTLYPGKSLIYNTGLDGSGTHCHSGSDLNINGKEKDVKIKVTKINTEENIDARLAIVGFLKNQSNFYSKIIKYLKIISGICTQKLKNL